MQNRVLLNVTSEFLWFISRIVSFSFSSCFLLGVVLVKGASFLCNAEGIEWDDITRDKLGYESEVNSKPAQFCGEKINQQMAGCCNHDYFYFF